MRPDLPLTGKNTRVLLRIKDLKQRIDAYIILQFLLQCAVNFLHLRKIITNERNINAEKINA